VPAAAPCAAFGHCLTRANPQCHGPGKGPRHTWPGPPASAVQRFLEAVSDTYIAHRSATSRFLHPDIPPVSPPPQSAEPSASRQCRACQLPALPVVCKVSSSHRITRSRGLFRACGLDESRPLAGTAYAPPDGENWRSIAAPIRKKNPRIVFNISAPPCAPVGNATNLKRLRRTHCRSFRLHKQKNGVPPKRAIRQNSAALHQSGEPGRHTCVLRSTPARNSRRSGLAVGYPPLRAPSASCKRDVTSHFRARTHRQPLSSTQTAGYPR